MPFGIQPIHIVIIIVVAFLIFGGSKLPEMGRSAGKAISEFRKGAKGMTDGFREEVSQPGATQTASQTIQPQCSLPGGFAFTAVLRTHLKRASATVAGRNFLI